MSHTPNTLPKKSRTQEKRERRARKRGQNMQTIKGAMSPKMQLLIHAGVLHNLIVPAQKKIDDQKAVDEVAPKPL